MARFVLALCASSCSSGGGGGSSSLASSSSEGAVGSLSERAFWSRAVSVGGWGFFLLLPVVGVGREAFVILLGVGPKARVCWARALVVFEGLRREGGILDGVGDGLRAI